MRDGHPANTRIHRMIDSPSHRARWLAERIYRKIQVLGTRQVRLYEGMLLTYPYPARRGYGTRGRLVGVYTIDTRLEWVLDDLLALLSDT